MLDKDQDGVLTEDDVMSVPADVVDEAFGQTPPGEVKTRIMIHLESSYASRKLPTYPSLKPTFCPKWELSVNVGIGEG